MTYEEAKKIVIEKRTIAAVRAMPIESMKINDAMQIACEAIDKLMKEKHE